MYLLFAGDNYYPSGGALDFLGAYPTEKAAVVAGAEMVKRQDGGRVSGPDWMHIVELRDDGTLRWVMGANEGDDLKPDTDPPYGWEDRRRAAAPEAAER